MSWVSCWFVLSLVDEICERSNRRGSRLLINTEKICPPLWQTVYTHSYWHFEKHVVDSKWYQVLSVFLWKTVGSVQHFLVQNRTITCLLVHRCVNVRVRVGARESEVDVDRFLFLFVTDCSFEVGNNQQKSSTSLNLATLKNSSSYFKTTDAVRHRSFDVK